MYTNRPFSQSERRPRYDRHRKHPQSHPQSHPYRQKGQQIPTVDQISKLMHTLNVQPYDPEHWSILPEREQRFIEQVVFQAPIYELSILYVLRNCQLRDTPSVVSFILDCMKRRWNNPILNY